MDKNFEKGRCPYAFNFFNGGLSEDNLYPYRKQGYARCVDISEYMGVTMPSVSRAVKELIKAEYLMKEVNGTLSLTIAGEKVAENVYERHCFFREKLLAAGVDLQTAEKDACRMEHGISEESFRKVKKAQES